MTVRAQQNKKRELTAGQILFCIMSILALVLTFCYSDVAIEAMKSGMKLCVGTVIPALFPFMIFSELFVCSGAARVVSRIIGKPLSRLFNISKEGGAAVLLGFLCGFPIGTKCAISLYERGRISHAELEHICSFCNNPSSAFLINAVGVTLFGSHSFGIMLFLVHIFSSCIVGMILGIVFKHKPREYCSKASAKENTALHFSTALSDAVKGSAQSMLSICAFVVFFSALVGYLRFFCDAAQLSDLSQVLLFGFLEMTSGVASAQTLPSMLAAPVVAMISGWSGLSVHFQLVGICSEHKISLRPYILSKLACAVLNFALTAFLLNAFSDKIVLTENLSISSFLSRELDLAGFFVLFVFGFSCLWHMCSKRRK